MSLSVNPLSQIWQDVGRMRAIAAILIRHGFGEFISRLNLQDNFITRMLGHQPKVEEGLSMPQRIVRLIQELGPTFIKLGQILSTRPDLIPEEYIQEFKALQSSALPLEFEVVIKVIEENLGRPLDEVFAKIEEKPLASASIAQVHTAYLHDGTEVVVKVQRPGIREILSSDLSIIVFLARRAAQLFPNLELIDPVGIALEFEKSLKKELDFTIETKNLLRFATNFKDNPHVHIPKVYREFSSDSILVMERIYGVKVTEVKTGQKLVVRRMLKIVFEMIYNHAFFHGDLHPGNILVEDSGRIGLIDFGLVGRLTPRMRVLVTDLIFGLIRMDYEAVAEVLLDIGNTRSPVNYDRFLNDVIELMDKHLVGMTMADIEFGVLVQDLLDGAMRHQIAVSPDYTMMFKALITAEGVGKQLYPELDILKELEPYVLALLKERYSPKSLLKRGYHHFNNMLRLVKEFPVAARQVLMAIENGRIQFGVDPNQIDIILREYKQQSASKIKVSLAAIFIVSATLALDHGTPRFFGIPTLSFLGYIMGLLFTIWVILGLRRK